MEGEKSRKSDQVSRCNSKSSSKYSLKYIAKSSYSLKSKSSTKAKAIEENLKLAELMLKASFIKNAQDPAKIRAIILAIIPDADSRRNMRKLYPS